MCFEESNAVGDVGEQKQKPEVSGAKPKRKAMLERNPEHRLLLRYSLEKPLGVVFPGLAMKGCCF